jgi:two-component system C4-dicarboxylate transport sensor histidine kinase DctB
MHTPLPHPSRPRWRSLALLALVLTPLLWPLQQLAERYYSGVLVEQNRQTLDLYVANLLGTLRRYEVLPPILGDLPALRLALQTPTDSTRLSNANHLLDQVREQTGADVIYLMDPDGKTLAASNWAQADSFVDRNFAFRPYFREAIAGRGASLAWAPPRVNADTTSPPPCGMASATSARWWSRSTWITPRPYGATPRNSCW